MLRVWSLSLGLVLVASTTLLPSEKIDLARAKVVLLKPQKKIAANAADMLRDEVEKRTRVALEVVPEFPASNEVALVLGTAGELAERAYRPPASLEVPAEADAYAIWIDKTRRPAATICIAGHDDRGTLFGVGRLLRLVDMNRDEITLGGATALATEPRYSLRGHQFAYRPKTNSYDGWTVEIWEQYFRDMVVFGMNAVEILPPRSDDADDSPHFPLPPLEMMAAMSQLADDYGIEVWIWYPGIDKDYSDPATLEFALKERDEIFRTLPRIDALFVPGGDPGNTHPEILFPFMKKQKELLNKYHPAAQLWVSPQGFDRKRDDWLRTFLDILKTQEPAWLEGVVFGPLVETPLANLRREVPGRYPIRRYPDITHSKSCQYPVPDWDHAYRWTEGRESINPRPRGHAKIFRDLQQYSMGYITYSEGCNDDVNKIVWSCLGWDPEMEVEEILRQYSRYFISQRYERKFARGLLGLEKNWQGPLLENDSPLETLRLFQGMEKDATPGELLNWRFQQGLYRAYYDAYLKHRLTYETGLEQQAMELLKKAPDTGSLAALEQAEGVLEKAVTERVATDLRARVFELAEALFQSIRMQLSVERYQASSVRRGANLEQIDGPLDNSPELQKRCGEIRGLASEKERLEAIAELTR